MNNEFWINGIFDFYNAVSYIYSYSFEVDFFGILQYGDTFTPDSTTLDLYVN